MSSFDLEDPPRTDSPHWMLVAVGRNRHATVLAYIDEDEDKKRAEDNKEKLFGYQGIVSIDLDMAGWDISELDVFETIPDDPGLYVWNGLLFGYQTPDTPNGPSEYETRCRGEWTQATIGDCMRFEEHCWLPTLRQGQVPTTVPVVQEMLANIQKLYGERLTVDSAVLAFEVHQFAARVADARLKDLASGLSKIMNVDEYDAFVRAVERGLDGGLTDFLKVLREEG